MHTYEFHGQDDEITEKSLYLIFANREKSSPKKRDFFLSTVCVKVFYYWDCDIFSSYLLSEVDNFFFNFVMNVTVPFTVKS